ncbi:Cilia- and flagella-associated protein 69 [Durusdinium trenchii]|uniref:Cilia- and flagella-associated protein 69 n=1 Tax=Durusdinium trenchii TaxID=1381693 RepID=A0ABP0PSS5_9DINO
MGSPVSPRSVEKLAATFSDPNRDRMAIPHAPDEVNFGSIMELMTSKYTVDLVDRHVAAIRKLCKVCCNGFLLQHLEPLVDLLYLAVDRFAQGQDLLAQALCDFTRVASQPFVSCKTSDMITYGHHLPAFVKGIVSVLSYTSPPSDNPPADPEAKAQWEHKKTMSERLRIEVAHTLACWARFGLDEESVELLPNQPLIQAVADSGTPNLRILRQSNVMDAVSASFRSEDSPESIVITLGAIRDMSLYRPLACQITNCGLISNLVHVIRVNLLGSDVLLVAAEVLWNVLELDWDGATEALGQEEVIESFRDFMYAVLTRGYRFKDKIFRNDMMVLLMYISKRVENRSLFASTGLMSLLLSYAVSAARRKELQASGILEEQQDAKLLPDLGDDGLKKGGIPIVNTQEDMEFRTLIWGTLARCCSSDDCARLAVKCDLVQSLLECLNPEPPVEQQKWSQEQRRKVQLEALSALFQLVQYMPDAFMDADGNSTVLQLLQATRSREVQKKSLHLLQVAVRMGQAFAEKLGQLGAVGTLVELFTDKDNPMTSRQMCASILATMCKECPANAREFRKKDGVEAMRDEVIYRPGDTTDNHLFYSLCVVDCIWNAVVGTRKNEIRFLDAGGLFALLDCLEVAPMILKRQIIGCLADLMEYKKAAKLFTQWNSQVTMKGALRLLLELWQSEQQAARNLAPDGVIQDLDQPLNPRTAVDMEDGDGSTITSTSHLATKFRHAKNFADTLGGQSVQSSPSANRTTVTKGFERASATAQEHQGSRWLKNDGGEQDSRAKIYSVLKCIGFECQETLSIAERQQMELVKLYPMAVELEMWIKVQESLASRGIKPVSADRQWITDSVSERKDQAAWVQSLQRQLAAERQREEEAGLDRFYKDLRGRAQIQRVTPPNGYPDDPLEGRGDEWSDEWSDDPDSP